MSEISLQSSEGNRGMIGHLQKVSSLLFINESTNNDLLSTYRQNVAASN